MNAVLAILLALYFALIGIFAVKAGVWYFARKGDIEGALALIALVCLTSVFALLAILVALLG